MLNLNYLKKLEKKVPTIQLLVNNFEKNQVFEYSNTTIHQRFQSASVGKVFCATLMMMSVEKKMISLDTNISKVLDEAMLDNLFVYKGIDYKNDVLVKHLLAHTSGVNDYFEGKTKGSMPFMKKLEKDPMHLYNPTELIDFTRNYQQAIAKPGEKFYYSDTGYNLLGLILEALYEIPYHQILRKYIIEPLKLKDTALCFYDEHFDQESLAPVLFKGKRMEKTNALSCDFAGGGLQTSVYDLDHFLRSLLEGKLISKDSLDFMIKPKHRFHFIMDYGHGMITIDFKRIVPWMRGYPKMVGGLGSLSVHAFIDPISLNTIIINLGDPSKMRLSFKLLVKSAKWLKNN
ncbi:MAG: serine hydrolase domain-containing protein [Candidatus Izemoplasmataceae bacterium]